MKLTFGHFSDFPKEDWRWKNFTPAEMADRKSRELVIVPLFMDWLQNVRNRYERPMIITSGYRTMEHQQTLPGHRTSGAHVDAMAVDVKVYGPHALELIQVATEHGVMGLGVHQTDDHNSRYIHLDMWDRAPDGVRPYVWSY